VDTTDSSPSRPEVAAGDPFILAASRRPDPDQESPPQLLRRLGFSWVGFEGEDENGEHVGEIERVPCRRCPNETA
jgi:hypothetical protein